MNSFKEIERKFLVNKSKLDLSKIAKFKKIEQGYVLRATDGSARIRIETKPETKKAWLVIKQKVDDMTNTEIVCDLNVQEAEHLLQNNCSHPYITKTRYAIHDGKVKWEIDEFHGHKEGLLMAEVELQDLSEDEIANLKLPDWILEEVTGQAEYYNVNM